MEQLLKELETQLRGMTAEQREKTTAALVAIVNASKGMADLQLSRPTVMRALQVLGVGMATGKTMRSHLADAGRLAPKIGKHVETLVHALS